MWLFISFWGDYCSYRISCSHAKKLKRNWICYPVLCRMRKEPDKRSTYRHSHIIYYYVNKCVIRFHSSFEHRVNMWRGKKIDFAAVNLKHCYALLLPNVTQTNVVWIFFYLLQSSNFVILLHEQFLCIHFSFTVGIRSTLLLFLIKI